MSDYSSLLSIPLQGQVIDVKPTGNVTEDTADVQAAINSAQAGDTVRFDSGTFDISQVTLKSGILYVGETGAVLEGSGSTTPMVMVNPNDSSNITIDNLTFDNGRVTITGNSSAASVNNITIANSTFENYSQTGVNSGDPLFLDWAKNTQIVNDTFNNIHGYAAIGAYHLENTAIVYNHFNSVYEGIQLIFDGSANTGQGIVVSDNVGNGINRMGIEIWDGNGAPSGDTQSLTVENNWFANWQPATLDSPNNAIAYSIVTNGGVGTVVENNYANAGSQMQGNIGIELAGTGAQALNNDIVGFKTGLESYQPDQVIENNNFVGANGSGNAAVGVYTSQSHGDTIQGNVTNASMPVPAQPTLTAASSPPTTTPPSTTPPPSTTLPSSPPSSGSSSGGGHGGHHHGSASSSVHASDVATVSAAAVSTADPSSSAPAPTTGSAATQTDDSDLHLAMTAAGSHGAGSASATAAATHWAGFDHAGDLMTLQHIVPSATHADFHMHG